MPIKWQKVGSNWESECGTYQVVEAAYQFEEPVFHCIKAGERRESEYLGYRATPELARELCEIHSGKV